RCLCFFSSRRRHTRSKRDWSSDVCSSDLQKIADIINFHLSSGLPPHEICVVAPRWEQIYPMANSLRKYLPSVSFDAPDIIPFKYDPMNPFYLLAQLLFTDAGTSTKSRKRIASELL